MGTKCWLLKPSKRIALYLGKSCWAGKGCYFQF